MQKKNRMPDDFDDNENLPTKHDAFRLLDDEDTLEPLLKGYVPQNGDILGMLRKLNNEMPTALTNIDDLLTRLNTIKLPNDDDTLKLFKGLVSQKGYILAALNKSKYGMPTDLASIEDTLNKMDTFKMLNDDDTLEPFKGKVPQEDDILGMLKVEERNDGRSHGQPRGTYCNEVGGN